MAKKQTRRSISMRPEIYLRLHDAAASAGQSATSWAEEVLTAAMDARGTRKITREEALRVLPESNTRKPRGTASGVWTF